MKQYSKRSALVHWIIFLLAIAAYYLGHDLDESKDTAQKFPIFLLHFLTGGLAMLLVLVRIYFRKIDGEPPVANASLLLNKVAAATHVLLNLSLIAVAVTGVVLLATSGVLKALQTGDPSLIPDFDKIAAHGVHQFFITCLLVLVAFHVAAALYHQLVIKDQLLRRIMVRRF